MEGNINSVLWGWKRKQRDLSLAFQSCPFFSAWLLKWTVLRKCCSRPTWALLHIAGFKMAPDLPKMTLYHPSNAVNSESVPAMVIWPAAVLHTANCPDAKLLKMLPVFNWDYVQIIVHEILGKNGIANRFYARITILWVRLPVFFLAKLESDGLRSSLLLQNHIHTSSTILRWSYIVYIKMAIICSSQIVWSQETFFSYCISVKCSIKSVEEQSFFLLWVIEEEP